MRIVQREIIWQIKLLRMYLSCSGRLQYYQQKKLYLVSGSETQELSFLPVLHGGICSHVSSSNDQQSLSKYIYSRARQIYLVSGQRQDSRSDQKDPSDSGGTKHYSPNLVERHSAWNSCCKWKSYYQALCEDCPACWLLH